MLKWQMRAVAALLVVLWATPGFAAATVGLHLLTDHHDHEDGAHSAALADALQAISHGHQHDFEQASEHEHHALLQSVPSLSGPIQSPAILHEVEELSDRDGSHRLAPAWLAEAGPPPLLFRTHCALLL